ncbi:MAG: LytR/AlgR family response regulator transcription factor [Ekhidna sp.]
MKVALIDDESPMRDNMKALLHKHVPEAQVIGEAEGVVEGLELLSSINPEVLFLDVEMKDGTGFDLISRYGKPDFQVVFVTGHDKYAIKAFKYSAIDYLLKPVDPLELKSAVEKVVRTTAIEQEQLITNFLDNNNKEAQDRNIVLKDADSVYLIAIKEIIRCQSDNNYTIFFLEDGRKLMVSRTLKEYERLFDDQPFFRTHQSHLINLSFFSKYEKREGGVVSMKDGSKIPVATRKKDVLLEILSQI